MSTTQLERHPRRWYSVRNPKSQCLWRLDSIATNKNFAAHYCKDLQPLSHSENSLKNQLLDNLLRRQLPQSLLERERDFKGIYFATFERRREQTARSHAYRNRFKLGHHLDLGQKVFYEIHRQDLSNSQKLQQRHLSSFRITNRITNTTYQIRDNNNPMSTKNLHQKKKLYLLWTKKMCLWIDVMTFFWKIHGTTISKVQQLRTAWHGRFSSISFWTSPYNFYYFS